MSDATLVLESTLTCSACGAAKVDTMPTDACQYFYECIACNTLLRPKAGDCCVFCSSGVRSLGSPPKETRHVPYGTPVQTFTRSTPLAPTQGARHDHGRFAELGHPFLMIGRPGR
jgi:hypothetical protein